MLRCLADVLGMAVGENEHAVIPLDPAGFTAHVTWRSGVVLGMNVARIDRLARLETSGHVIGLAAGNPRAQKIGHVSRGNQVDLVSPADGFATVEFSLR